MAALAVKHLRQRGVGRVRILNRSIAARPGAGRANGFGFRRHGRTPVVAPRGRPRRLRDRRHRSGGARRDGPRGTAVAGLAARPPRPGRAARRGSRSTFSRRCDGHRRGCAALSRFGRGTRCGRAGSRDRGRGGPTLRRASPRRRTGSSDPRDPSPRRRGAAGRAGAPRGPARRSHRRRTRRRGGAHARDRREAPARSDRGAEGAVGARLRADPRQPCWPSSSASTLPSSTRSDHPPHRDEAFGSRARAGRGDRRAAVRERLPLGDRPDVDVGRRRCDVGRVDRRA